VVIHFICSWNGFSVLRSPYAATVSDLLIQTNASGAWGCGAVFYHRWLQLQWSREWMGEAIMAKELVPIVLAIVIWGHQLARRGLGKKRIVTAINKISCREAVVIHLLWCMWFFVAHFDIKLVVAKHLPGKDNTIADLLSGKFSP